jgi:uncharacterized membrane protein YdbT with pleckstrin-like domain
MITTRKETTLARERLHWGVFIPALLAVFFLTVGAIPILFFLNLTANMTSQLNHQEVHTGWIWLIAFMPDLAIGGTVLLVTWLAYSHSEITLTSQRLIFRTGFLSRMAGELPLQNVETIFIFEPLLGRLFGFGTILITSVGGASFPLRFIGSPQIFHATLQKAVADAKAPSKPVSKPVTPQQDDDSRFMPKG